VILVFSINFNNFLIKLRNAYPSEFDYFEFLNIGSCGSNTFELNSYHFIDRAIKYDRGVLGNGSLFQIRKDKIITTEIKSQSYFDYKTILSGNFLFELFEDKVHCNQILSEINEELINRKINQINNILADMETFDFIKVCEVNNANCLGGFRIVSDDGKKNSKDKRIFRFNFCKTKDILFKLIKDRSKSGYLHNRIKYEDMNELLNYDVIKISNLSLLSINTVLENKNIHSYFYTKIIDNSFNNLLDKKNKNNK